MELDNKTIDVQEVITAENMIHSFKSLLNVYSNFKTHKITKLIITSKQKNAKS